MDFDEEGCQRLANEIIILAAKDYRKALKYRWKKQIAEIESFFHSDWYKVLTDVDGEMILRGLKEEAKDNDK